MAKDIIDKILDSIFDEEWIGKHGEKLTERELKLVRILGRKGKILRNVYIPKDNGETTEIDVVYITQKGIFVIESKNYSGWIFGDEKGTYWTVTLPNGHKNRFYNPVKQNKTHIKWLQAFVGNDVPLFSVIAFSERCELKKIDMESTDVKVIKRDRLYATVRDIWDSHPDVVEDVDGLFKKLEKLTNVDDAIKAAHIKNIEDKYKSPSKVKTEKVWKPINEPVYDEPQQEPVGANHENSIVSEMVDAEDLICPKCGKKLVLRTAGKGANAGKQFYGCSGFPKCRYVRNI